jgi:hypothetical protein
MSQSRHLAGNPKITHILVKCSIWGVLIFSVIVCIVFFFFGLFLVAVVVVVVVVRLVGGIHVLLAACGWAVWGEGVEISKGL